MKRKFAENPSFLIITSFPNKIAYNNSNNEVGKDKI